MEAEEERRELWELTRGKGETTREWKETGLHLFFQFCVFQFCVFLSGGIFHNRQKAIEGKTTREEGDG